MQSHYPDVKVIQTSQGCPSTEKRKIYPVQSVSPPSARVHYEDETTTLEPPRLINFYLTGAYLSAGIFTRRSFGGMAYFIGTN